MMEALTSTKELVFSATLVHTGGFPERLSEIGDRNTSCEHDKPPRDTKVVGFVSTLSLKK
jgi:hypothetical protein